LSCARARALPLVDPLPDFTASELPKKETKDEKKTDEK
jgi:hypothetical protein